MSFDNLVFFESLLLAGIFGGSLFLFFLLVRLYLMDRRALSLLRENREIESLNSKRERAVRLLEWKQKRDSALNKAESFERELSESN